MNYYQFYKPNSRNTGMAVSIKVSDKDGGLYISMIRQSGWNDKTKTGSFKANMDNPRAKKSIKLNAVEAGGIIRAINERGKWSSFHKFSNGESQSGVSLSFSIFEKEGVNVGFGFRILDSKDKESPFSVSFTMDEAEVLKLYFEEFIKGIFHKKTGEVKVEAEYEAQEQPDEPKREFKPKSETRKQETDSVFDLSSF
jgi:outer membrane usher protein FimD/PapC